MLPAAHALYVEEEYEQSDPKASEPSEAVDEGSEVHDTSGGTSTQQGPGHLPGVEIHMT